MHQTMRIIALIVCLVGSRFAFAADKEIYLTEDYVLVPNDNIVISIHDKFNLTHFRNKFINKSNYRIQLGYMMEDGVGEFLNIFYDDKLFIRIFGDLKTKRIEEILTESNNAFGPSGTKTGDNIISSVGKFLRCNFELYSFCEDPSVPEIRYYAECPEAESKNYRDYLLGDCSEIVAMSLSRHALKDAQ